MRGQRLVFIATFVFILALGLFLPRAVAGQAPSSQPPPTPQGVPVVPPFVRPTLAPSVQALASPEKDGIVAAIEGFLRSEDFFDAAAFDAVVHPDAKCWTDDDGQANHTQWVEYVTWLRSSAQKPAPRNHSGEARTITDLVQHGSFAQAVLEWRLSPKRPVGTRMYYGFQLFKGAERWQIVGLTYYSNRLEGQTDARTLDAMGVRPGMTIGEVGAGTGRFTVPLARRVGGSGKVLANDIAEAALKQLAARVQRLGLGNVETVIGNVDDPLFPKGALDMVVMVWVFHHLDQPVALLRNAAASLRAGGTIVILDPAYERTDERDSDRPSTEESVRREAAEAGLELVRTERLLPLDDIYILRVKAPVR